MNQTACPRRRWGKTELSIPVIPFGTQGFGNNFGHVRDDEAIALIERAVELGINHFDCARCYGDSLHKLGLALKQKAVERSDLVISSRLCCHSGAPWGGYGEGEPDYSAQRALDDVEDQLSILGIDYFDAMLVHDPLAVEPTLAAGGTLEGLERARQRGHVRFLGYGMNPHEFHLAVIASGRTEVMLTFSDYNLLRTSAGERLLPAAAQADMGVLNGWSIMRGCLTGTPVVEFVPRERWHEDHERADAMRQWCEERDVSLLQVALQFCLRDERIHGNPLGNLNAAQLEMNVAAAASPLPRKLIDEFVAAGL